MSATVIVDNRNYLTMRQRIAREIKRDNLDQYICDAIGDAIYYYQQMRFFFSQNTDSSTVLVQGVNTYTPPDDLIEIDELTMTIAPPGGGQSYVLPLEPHDISWILERDLITPPEQGQPTDYAFFDNKVRVYITPDGQNAYTLNYYYTAIIPPPVNDNDAGYWMTDAELMIRTFAKGLLYGSVLRNLKQAEAEMLISRQAFLQLSRQNNALLSTGETKPTKF